MQLLSLLSLADKGGQEGATRSVSLGIVQVPRFVCPKVQNKQNENNDGATDAGRVQLGSQPTSLVHLHCQLETNCASRCKSSPSDQ